VAAGSARAFDFLRQALVEQAAVETAGQRVGHRQLAYRFERRFELGGALGDQGRRAEKHSPCRAHIRLQADTVPQADRMRSEPPAPPFRRMCKPIAVCDPKPLRPPYAE
jgi:hypothetical protein